MSEREKEISSLRIPSVRSAKSSMLESCDLPRTIGIGRSKSGSKSGSKSDFKAGGTRICKDGTIRDSRFPSTSRPSRSFHKAMMDGPKTVSYSRTKRTLPDEEYGHPGLEVFMSFGSQSPNVGDFLSCIRSRDIQNRFTPCPGAKKKPTVEEYKYYLSIYDSNMSYFRQEIALGKNKSTTISKVNAWFSCIAEPCPETDDEDDLRQWQEREEKRISTGISAYWDPSILGEPEPETE